MFAKHAALFEELGVNVNNGLGDVYEKIKVEPDQINMAVLFWYLVKSDVSVRYCTVATGLDNDMYVLQGTRTERPCITGHSVSTQTFLLSIFGSVSMYGFIYNNGFSLITIFCSKLV